MSRFIVTDDQRNYPAAVPPTTGSRCSAPAPDDNMVTGMNRQQHHASGKTVSGKAKVPATMTPDLPTLHSRGYPAANMIMMPEFRLVNRPQQKIRAEMHDGNPSVRYLFDGLDLATASTSLARTERPNSTRRISFSKQSRTSVSELRHSLQAKTTFRIKYNAGAPHPISITLICSRPIS